MNNSHSTRLKPAVLAGFSGLVLASAINTAKAEIIQESLETDHLTLSIERIADGFEHPWAVAFLPDGRYLVSERSGQLKLVDPESGEANTLEGMPEVSTQGQGGLLDVTLHPDFEGENSNGDNDWIYFTWSKPDGNNSRSALSRVKWQNDQLGEVEHLFEQDRASGPGRHYGSRLAWLPDGTLLMSIGDRGSEPPRAQARDDHAGSTLRLTDTGGVPDDNPFVGDDTTLDEIYSMGNRNIQGMTVLSNGEAWASEHGPRTGDELNHIEAGNNYGWPTVSQGNDYATNEPIGEDSLPGMVDPVYLFEGRFAPAGLAEVTSEAFGEWQGSLLAGGLGSEKLLRLRLDEGRVAEEELILQGEVGRIRDVRQGPDDAIYLLTDEPQGGLYRLAPTDQ
ncbi:PQQ-dependent sugar dehydrogenase [Halomonas boliviensis]|uniref:Glucose sorbosone dehydrogenase n=2 Tax=Oceanospirillales TaxID=135619 RepID=A0A246S188_9GAMM|nr:MULTISPECIES: PQQ-dependent sugar dehydrogenase [Halomonas]MBS3670098.1 PQQ-dependent sugar dehydrogenase [Halomonas boliviensis]OWV30151.1 glucose sorbosone dehydrogenase [Halomonas campaniensis]